MLSVNSSTLNFSSLGRLPGAGALPSSPAWVFGDRAGPPLHGGLGEMLIQSCREEPADFSLSPELGQWMPGFQKHVARCVVGDIPHGRRGSPEHLTCLLSFNSHTHLARHSVMTRRNVTGTTSLSLCLGSACSPMM